MVCSISQYFRVGRRVHWGGGVLCHSTCWDVNIHDAHLLACTTVALPGRASSQWEPCRDARLHAMPPSPPRPGRQVFAQLARFAPHGTVNLRAPFARRRFCTSGRVPRARARARQSLPALRIAAVAYIRAVHTLHDGEGKLGSREARTETPPNMQPLVAGTGSSSVPAADNRTACPQCPLPPTSSRSGHACLGRPALAPGWHGAPAAQQGSPRWRLHFHPRSRHRTGFRMRADDSHFEFAQGLLAV